MGMITEAVQNKAKTFTDLLHITKLPRKTLSLRLKELCVTGTIIKEDGCYRSGGDSGTIDTWHASTRRFSNALRDKRIRTGLLMMSLLISVPAFSYALASIFTPPQAQGPRPIIGNFAMILEAHSVENLAAWQAAISYNMSELSVLNVTRGNFLGEAPVNALVYHTDIADNVLALTDTVVGDNMPARSGSGILATITFGYFSSKYQMPTIADCTSQLKQLKPYWIQSDGSPDGKDIPFEIGSTITLTVQ